ncbi:hypothetical protein MTO96_001014 [Rhipicephalus appendiculatus]
MSKTAGLPGDGTVKLTSISGDGRSAAERDVLSPTHRTCANSFALGAASDRRYLSKGTHARKASRPTNIVGPLFPLRNRPTHKY